MSTASNCDSVEREAVRWDPFFGPPVRLGEGGRHWKSAAACAASVPTDDEHERVSLVRKVSPFGVDVDSHPAR